MNIFKTLVLITLITLGFQTYAFSKTPSDDLKSVSQQIKTYLKHSEIKIYDDITVMIKFKLNKNNKIIVISNDSNNYDISKFIKARLNLKELSIDEKSNYIFYTIPVKFLSTTD